MWCEILGRTPISRLNQDLSEIKFQLYIFIWKISSLKKKFRKHFSEETGLQQNFCTESRAHHIFRDIYPKKANSHYWPAKERRFTFSSLDTRISVHSFSISNIVMIMIMLCHKSGDSKRLPNLKRKEKVCKTSKHLQKEMLTVRRMEGSGSQSHQTDLVAHTGAQSRNIWEPYFNIPVDWS